MKDSSPLLETLFIFATEKDTIENVLKTVDDQKSEGTQKRIEISKNSHVYELLIPKYENTPKDNSKLKKIKFIVMI